MQILTAFTMDCENLDHLSGVGGVSDWEFSERAIRGYCDLLDAHVHKATLFLCPETAVAHKGWLLELKEGGHELALHFHPDSFLDGKENGLGQLGQYSGDRQREMLQDGLSVWSDALGHKPDTFRAGCFSTNDETFSIIENLGFPYTSTSSPGRNEPSISAIWQPALLDVHQTHRALRALHGDMGLIEVPLTVDWQRRFPHRLGWELPQELMLERAEPEMLRSIIEKHVSRFLEEQPQTPYICSATHNVWDYSDASAEMTSRLSGLIMRLQEMETDEVEFVPATIFTIGETFRSICGD